MALMTSMREKMHFVLWGLLAMFILSMMVGGLVGGANIIDQLVGNVNPQTTIARINDQDISPDYFNQLVNQQIEQLRSQGQKVNDFTLNRARTTAWDNLLQDVLVSQEVDRLKLSATDEEVMFHLENNPPPFLQNNPSFQTDGAFDLKKYRDALANPQGDEWVPIETFMKTTFIPNFKLQKILDENIIITDNDVKNEFIKRNVDFTVTALHVTSAKVPNEESEPTDEELLADYEENKTDFEHDELRDITFVSWKKEPTSQDSISVEKLATAIMERAQDGEDFASLANEYSDDPGNQGINGGDLGWFGEGRMVKEFEKAAFNANKGDIVGPVKSNFGYHVISVRDKKKEDGKVQILASHILFKIEMSPTTLSNLKRTATLFSYDAQDNGFDEAVASHGLETTRHGKINEGSFSIRKLGGLRAGVRFAFNNKTGAVSDILENDNYFAIIHVDSVIAPGIRSFDEVSNQLKGKLKKEKVMAATLEKANKLLVQVSSGTKSLETLMDEDSELEGVKDETKKLTQGFTSVNRSNYVTGALLASNVGEIVGPLETGRGHALIEVKAIADMDSTEFEIQKATLRRTIFGRKQNQYFQSWLDDLKSNADIVDNRKYYF